MFELDLNDSGPRLHASTQILLIPYATESEISRCLADSVRENAVERSY